MKNPLLSVIIPIYNIERYLAEAIESVLQQTIGFMEKIELILVDDGSLDTSGDISQEYANKYPDNITYVRLKNGGVSRARNKGLSLARGTYVHFFDGDDLLSKDFYQRTVDFLENQVNEIDVVTVKLMFFDEIIDSHPLNVKFKHDRIIDLTKEPNAPFLHAVSGVFRHSALKDVRFNEKLSIAEDVTFLSDVLHAKKKYGVLSAPTYYYRKRTDGSSALGSRARNKNNYLDVPQHAYTHILDTWAESGSSAMEYTVLYDLSYRLDQKEQALLTAEEEKIYKQSILAIAQRCSDEAIVTNSYLTVHQKMYILKKKYTNTASEHLHTKGEVTYFDDFVLFNHRNNSVFIDFLTHKGAHKYMVEGFVAGFIDVPDISWYININEKRTKLKFIPRSQREQSFLGDTYYDGGAFEVVVDIPLHAKVQFECSSTDASRMLPIETSSFTKFGALKLTYRRDSDRLFKRTASALESAPYSVGRHVLLELRMLFQILLNWKFNTAKMQLKKLLSRNLDQLSTKAKLFEILKPGLFMAEAVAMIPRAFLLRISYYIAKRFKKRPIWLISDRGTAAGDNGEALFRYIAGRKDCPADVYFVISKKAKDLPRLQSIGNVIFQESLRYKLKFLLSDKIIASQADVETTNPFIRQLDHYVDLFRFDFVFLQHGIIRHNLSNWLNRFNKNITLFITSAQKEYDSIFTNPYYYAKNNVLLSGLPRYDYLNSKPAGKLILAPTYRKSIVKEKTDRLGRRNYDPTFKKSYYREFYNTLINDERITRALKEANMTGEFYLHPVFAAQREDFDENDTFTMMSFPYDYKTAFSEGNMLISDHSSVVFDFAYLKKPVAYAHFDADTFFDGHSYDKSNFFSDEMDGFGEVYIDYETLVDGVVRTISEGCIMDKKYQKRVDEFFYRVDKHNSERVYDAIMKLDT